MRQTNKAERQTLEALPGDFDRSKITYPGRAIRGTESVLHLANADLRPMENQRFRGTFAILNKVVGTNYRIADVLVKCLDQGGRLRIKSAKDRKADGFLVRLNRAWLDGDYVVIQIEPYEANPA